MKATIFWGCFGSADNLRFVQLLFFWSPAGSWVTQHVLRVHPLPPNFSLTHVLISTYDGNGHWVTHCQCQTRWFNVLGFISVSSLAGIWICTDVCRYTHMHYHKLISASCSYYFHICLPLFVPILLFFEPDWICDFMTHCPCTCAMSLWLHTAVLQSILSSVPVFVDKGCPSFRSARYVEALSFQRKMWRGADFMMMA